MATRTQKILSTEVAVGSQSAHFTQVFEAHGHKCKIDIKRDSYDFQSYARVYVWQKDKLEWSLVDSLHYTHIKTEEKLHVYARIGQAHKVNADAFATDRIALLNKLSNILA